MGTSFSLSLWSLPSDLHSFCIAFSWFYGPIDVRFIRFIIISICSTFGFSKMSENKTAIDYVINIILCLMICSLPNRLTNATGC